MVERMETTWMKALDVFNKQSNINWYNVVDNMFEMSEDDSLTCKHLKELALEFAICVVDECEDCNTREDIIAMLSSLVSIANSIRKGF